MRWGVRDPPVIPLRWKPDFASKKFYAGCSPCEKFRFLHWNIPQLPIIIKTACH
jgi:hypothetical protein